MQLRSNEWICNFRWSVLNYLHIDDDAGSCCERFMIEEACDVKRKFSLRIKNGLEIVAP